MLISLLTDFGDSDEYVGVMKGVMLSINPNLKFIDITHSISPGDIRRGAFILFKAYKYFPKRTIFLVIVDPGVGTGRKSIIVQTANYFFVCPDNGVMSYIYREGRFRVYEIRGVKPESTTFHGRDIFAPTAAKLSLGTPVEELGSPIKNYETFTIPYASLFKRRIEGEVVDIDRFGNLITNIPQEMVKKPIVEIKVGRRVIKEIKENYSGSAPVGIFGSSGLLEISIPGGSCSQFLGIERGEEIVVKLK